MGSPDADYGRQLNGMGGGVSSLSKICVIEQPTPSQQAEGIHVAYTFCQIGIKDASVDYSGNCGNLSSVIGVYAADEGLCSPVPHSSIPQRGTVRAFNTNTNKIIETTFPIDPLNGAAPLLDKPEVSIAGVSGQSSQIDLHFLSPSGARTGKLLPTGRPVDTVTVLINGKESTLRVSLVDASNPTVFVASSELAAALRPTGAHNTIDFHNEQVRGILEAIRRQGAEFMGLDPSAQAQPKISVLSRPASDNGAEDIVAHSFSMGVLHKAIPMTVGLCLGVASRVEGTLAWEIVQQKTSGQAKGRDCVTILHPGGTVEVDAEFSSTGEVKSAKVIRTGRRLMKGVVWW